MTLLWEKLDCERLKKGFLDTGMNPMLRAKVPGGWFVRIEYVSFDSAFFYPDPEHLWDGSSLP